MLPFFYGDGGDPESYNHIRTDLISYCTAAIQPNGAEDYCQNYNNDRRIDIFNLLSLKICNPYLALPQLLAAVLITVYVSILSNHIEELQLEKRSKGEHVLLYIYVCVSILVQLFFAFHFYRVILFSYHDEHDDEHQHEDTEELLRIAKYWTIASYLILLNFVIKTGVYSQRCRCVISLTLGIYVFAIFFRICAIFTVRAFIVKLEKLREEITRKEKLRIIMGLHQFRP